MWCEGYQRGRSISWISAFAVAQRSSDTRLCFFFFALDFEREGFNRGTGGMNPVFATVLLKSGLLYFPSWKTKLLPMTLLNPTSFWKTRRKVSRAPRPSPEQVFWVSRLTHPEHYKSSDSSFIIRGKVRAKGEVRKRKKRFVTSE
jgi:hypothetical protein